MAEELTSSRQMAFHQLLVGAREKWLVDALRGAVISVDPNVLKRQMTEYVPSDAQTILASSGVRDEEIFATPAMLEAQPTLVGYYRLLLGMSQKAFYRGGTGMGPLKSMEISGTLTEKHRLRLPEFCRAINLALADLVRRLSPTITPRDLNDLPLLTLGGQLQGASNVLVGQLASIDVFLATAEVVKSYISERSATKLVVKNASGRLVVISLGADPDVRIQEEFGEGLRNKVAIEIKGELT